MKLLVAIAMSLVTLSAQAVQVSGLYTCANNVTTTTKANGRTAKNKSSISSQVIYNADGTSLARTPNSPLVGRGTWTQQGNRLYGSPNIDDMAAQSLLGCQSTGAACMFIGATGGGSAKVARDGNSFAGTSTAKLTMVVNGIWVNSTSTNKFRCYR